MKIDDSVLAVLEFDSNTEWEERIYAFEAANVITEIQFIPASSEHATRGGFIDNVRLRRVVVEDNIPATGVDAMSLEVDSDDIGYQPDYWIMAPLQGPPLAGGHAYENLTHLKMEEIPDTNSELIVSNATPNPESFALDGNFHEIRWQGGNGTGVNDESRVSIKLDDVEEEYEVNVRVKTMKHRTVKLMIYPTGKYRTGRDPLLPNPDFMPDKGELESHLNQLFAYQMNTWFEVTFAPETIIVDWGDDFQYLAELGAQQHSPDQTAVIEAHGGLSADHHMHLFLIAQNVYMTNTNGTEAAKAVATPGQNTCWVLARPLLSSYSTKDHALETIAHEIGHIFFGAGHPDAEEPDNRGVAPLLGTDHAIRLMYSKNNSASRLTVKAEWDKAERWLIEQEATNPMSQ